LSGLLIAPFFLTEALSSVLCGIYINKTGRYREILWAGTVLLTIGNGLYLFFSVHTPIVEVIVIEVISGIGAGFLFLAPLIALQATVSQEDTATATATYGFIQNLASAFSVVIGGVIFQSQINIRVPELNLPSDIIHNFTMGGAAAHVDKIAMIPDAGQQMLIKDAFAWSLRHMWIFYACISFVAILASLFVKKRVLSTEHVETKTGLMRIDADSDSES